MRAIRQHAFGGPDELRLEEVPDPHPNDGQVRIRVESAGVHLVDTAIRRGEQTGAFALPELPMTPGREVAGTVEALGEGVDPLWLDKSVVAHLGMASGGYAELALAAVDSLHEIPDNLDVHRAVAMIGTGRTTMAILEIAEPTDTDVVLVTAAAGGIGSLLVKAGRNAGATVVGAAGGADKAALAGGFGATVTLDYTQPGWTEAARDFLDGREITLAFDGVGGDIGRGAFELLGIGGRLALYGWSSGTPLTVSSTELVQRSLTVAAAIGPRIVQRPGGLRHLESRALAEAAAGRLEPVVGRPFPLGEADAAHAAIEARATVGKTVLRP